MDFKRLHEAKVNGADSEVQEIIITESLRHYSENCRFLAPGMEVLTGREGKTCM